jgi:poly(3-hydroxybutyrate) depolymerase
MKKVFRVFILSVAYIMAACSQTNDHTGPPIEESQEALVTTLVGDTVIRPQTDSIAPGEAEAFRYTAMASGTLATLKVYIDPANKAKNIKYGVYTTATNGDPGLLLTKGTLATPVKSAWNTVTLSPQVLIASGTHYWIAVMTAKNTTSPKFRVADIGVYGSRLALQNNLTDLPNTWTTHPVSVDWDGWTMSAYGLSIDVPGTGGVGGSAGTGAGGMSAAGTGAGGQATAGNSNSGGAGANTGGQPSAGASGIAGSGTAGSASGAGGAGTSGMSGADAGGQSGAGGMSIGGAGQTGGQGGIAAGGAGAGGQATAGAGAGGTAGSGGMTSGCGTTPPQTGTFTLNATDGNGTTRSYTVIVPSTANATTPLAVTFAYHGFMGTSQGMMGMGLQNATGAGSASIFVFPQGIQYESYGVGWDDTCGGRDMILFDHMLDRLNADYCIDPNRVFSIGFSWGGDHSVALACCRGSRIRAVVVSSATNEFTNSANYTTYWNYPCPSSPAPAAKFTYDLHGDPYYSGNDFAATDALFRERNSCTLENATVLDSNCTQYSCATPFISCNYPGMGHDIPNGPGPWAESSWQFFSSFP